MRALFVRFRLRIALFTSLVSCIAGFAAAGRAQVPNWPSERPPRALAARPVSFPPYEIRTLANGMQVMVVMHHEQPVVSVRLLARAGGAYDPPGKHGVASLVASLLDQGTTTRTSQQIADTIDSIGGALDTGAGDDLTSVNVLVMKDSFALAMDLVADVVRRPTFDGAELDRQRQQTIASLKVNYDDPGFVATAVLGRLIYGFHPYGLPQSGTPDSLAKITREDVREFHRKYFAPNNCIFAIVGDIQAAEAFAGVERAFGDWPRQTVEAPALPELPRPTRRVVVIDKPDAVQTAVRVGQLGVPRKTPDYMTLDLALRILGGEGSNRLYRVLRAERGLTYSASAEMNTRLRAGDFMAETDTRTEVTGEALSLMVDEFYRLQRERTSQYELSGAQAYMTGSFPLTIETPEAIARQVLNALFYDLSLDELRTYRERVNDVTVDGIQRVARQYLEPDRLSIVLVGNASAFRDQLSRAGFGRYEIIPLSDLDLTAADFKKKR
jgi:zinc protease